MSPSQQREYETVILGALLHDIGKYLQRGDFGGRVSGQHPQVGATFVSAWQAEFGRCVDVTLLRTLVQRHHESTAFREGLRVDEIADEHTRALARLVSRADNLSSSERGERAAKYQQFRTTALAPVFHRIQLLRTPGPSQSHLPHGAIRDLEGEPPIFPRPGRQTPQEEVTQHIRDFGQAFVSLRDRLDWDDFWCVYGHLFSLLQKFTVCVASDTQADPPDISLFDHLRTTSAIAACLYQHHVMAGTLKDEVLKGPVGPRCALLVGDLSGIQDYLFDIATVGAGGVARRLRARSFFLQMLAEVAGLKVLRAFNLPPANVLMASGGKFYVLLPVIPALENCLEALRRECDNWLLSRFHGTLTLNLAWTAITDKEFGTGAEGASFSIALTRLHAQLSARKRRRLEGTLVREGQWHEADFLRDPFPADASVCRACGRFPAAYASEEPGELDVCRHCYQDLRLGRRLPRAEFVGLYDRTLEKGTECFGWSFFVAERPDALPSHPFSVRRLNATDLELVAGYPANFRFLANHVPLDPDDATPWSFGDIAAGRRLEEGEPAPGLLAVIKADVDYLGQVFQDGLRREQPPGFDTPSRVATLSRQMDWFFSAWMQWLLSKGFPRFYTVFSGGDDVLLVGPRGQALALVKHLREEFRRYTENPEMTLSAGIAVIKPRLPLAQAVRFADEGLEAAKRAGRDRLSLLGCVLRWEDLPLVEEALNLLERADPPPTSAFLYRLLEFAKMWRRWRETHDPMALRVQPLLAYTIARNLKPGSELYTWASRLVGFSLSEDQSEPAVILDHLGVIVQWVLLGRRDKRNGDDE
jgi:CRISPR-associated protein Csm1